MPDPGAGNQPGLRSKLELPAAAQRLLTVDEPARRAGKRTKSGRRRDDQLALALDSGVTGRKPGASKLLPNLSEAAVGWLVAADPGWLARHPPGSRATIEGRTYLVPAYHPEVATETPEALVAIQRRAVQLDAGLAGERHETLKWVRRHFPEASPDLVQPWWAHELARAAYIGEQLEARAAAAAPAAALDFGEVYRICARVAAAHRQPRWHDFGGPKASPAERRAAMRRGLAYLESIAAAVKASPAWRSRVSEDEVAAGRSGRASKAQEAGRR